MYKIALILFLAFLSYSAYTYIGYSDILKNSKFFLITGLAISLICNTIWLLGVKKLDNPSQIFWLSIGFDLIVTICSIYIPVMQKKITLNYYAWIGISFIILGIFIIKNIGIKEN